VLSRGWAAHCRGEPDDGRARFQRRLNLAMGIYAVLLSISFMAAFPIGSIVVVDGWRTAWAGLGCLLPGLVIWRRLTAVPKECGLALEAKAGWTG
jgi:hypothetical protein